MFKIIFRYSLFIALTLSVAGYFRVSTLEFIKNQKDQVAKQQVRFQASSSKLEDQELVFIEIDEKEEEESERSSLKKQVGSAISLTHFSFHFLSSSNSVRLQTVNHTHLLAYAQPTYLMLRVFRL